MPKTRATFSFGRFEEFNLNRTARFKGQTENTTLIIVHELDAQELLATQKYIECQCKYKAVKLVNVETFKQEINNYPITETAILILHLKLDTEIHLHQELSALCFKRELFQLNPYNKIAKLFDDKYLFYVLMTANEIKQAQTINLPCNNTAPLALVPTNLKNKSIIIKPRHGTEKIDTMHFDNASQGLTLIQQVHQYDDCMLQEFISSKNEYKALYLQGKFYLRETNIPKGLQSYLSNFIDVLDNYARQNKIILPSIFSIDLLEKENDQLIILEANIRPAAIYSFINLL